MSSKREFPVSEPASVPGAGGVTSGRLLIVDLQTSHTLSPYAQPGRLHVVACKKRKLQSSMHKSYNCLEPTKHRCRATPVTDDTFGTICGATANCMHKQRLLRTSACHSKTDICRHMLTSQAGWQERQHRCGTQYLDTGPLLGTGAMPQGQLSTALAVQGHSLSTLQDRSTDDTLCWTL